MKQTSAARSDETTRLAAGLARWIGRLVASAIGVGFFFAIIGVWEMPVAIGSLLAFVAITVAIMRWCGPATRANTDEFTRPSNHD